MKSLAGFKIPAGLSAPDLIQWLALASNAVKAVSPSLLVSHAPQAPYFGPVGGSGWAGVTGGYTGVNNAANKSIDW